MITNTIQTLLEKRNSLICDLDQDIYTELDKNYFMDGYVNKEGNFQKNKESKNKNLHNDYEFSCIDKETRLLENLIDKCNNNTNYLPNYPHQIQL